LGADDESLQQTPNIHDDDLGLQGHIPQDCSLSSPEMFPEKNPLKGNRLHNAILYIL